LLAAQCLAKGHVLATDNTKHFALLKPLGLKTENPLVG
jgi:predicted nucleic acid-binding protein